MTLVLWPEMIETIPQATFGWPDSPRTGRLWTARYWCSGIVPSGLAPVRITLGAPRFPLRFGLAGEIPNLVPPRSTFRKPYLGPTAFRAVYGSMLDGIGVDRIRAQVDAIRETSGADPVLLCFEDVRDGADWCHRLIFAEWWREQTGEPVLELLDQPPVV